MATDKNELSLSKKFEDLQKAMSYYDIEKNKLQHLEDIQKQNEQQYINQSNQENKKPSNRYELNNQIAYNNKEINNNNIQQQSNNEPSLLNKQYHLVQNKRLSPKDQDQDYQQKIKEYQSPKFNEINNNENFNNNIAENNNENVNMNSTSFQQQSQQYEYAELNQHTSQKDNDITISDRDNPLIYSDDIGNMNYLEKQYAAYQNKINRNFDNNY